MWNRVGGDNGSLFGTTRVGFRHPIPDLRCVRSGDPDGAPIFGVVFYWE